ncbi:MAG TPA: glycoside hydrolase family 2 TIM barrel-domain containing protein [Tepidisphaeraceae bacterium]|jgi:beta-mannosidase
MKLQLAKMDWQLRGFRPAYWFSRNGLETTGPWEADVPPLPAIVPGSVQTALRKVGKLPDWNVGQNSFLCQWVEHFQWEFFVDLSAIKVGEEDSVWLHCEGLDYSGWIGIDGKRVSHFRGAFEPHRFNLTKFLHDGKLHRLSILFDLPPEEQGQAGWTTKTKYFKPRFNFSWDWTPRFVPIGIWDSLWLEVGPVQPRVVKAICSLAEDLQTGRVDVEMESDRDVTDVTISVSRAGKIVGRKDATLNYGRQTISLDNLSVEPWFPNGYGKQPLYELTVESAQEVVDRRTIGFKRVEWQANPGAPADAENLLCVINAVPIFLQGVNWTPIRIDYHDIRAAEYRKRIDLYKKMGCTVLRVWGGAYLEREIFYDLCDRAGVLVWQEFPLSSSTGDSATPTDPAAIMDLIGIARQYIRRRGHHPSKLLWCGGNELQTRPDNDGKSRPLQADDPCLAALKKVVEQEDPQTKFLPTSPTGRVFYAHLNDFGSGELSHVHGPWNHRGTWEEAVEYWSKDDSSFRSECGMPSAQSMALMKKYGKGMKLWPPAKDNPYWTHTSLFWLPKEQFAEQLRGLKGEAALKKLVAITEDWQTRILQLAAQSCKARFPRCSGFIVWMGHDCFPCPINTSIIDFAGKPKPVYEAIKKVFRRKPRG